MAKALLPLLALSNRGLRNPGLEEGRVRYPGWGWACSFFLEGVRILGCYRATFRPFLVVPY